MTRNYINFKVIWRAKIGNVILHPNKILKEQIKQIKHFDIGIIFTNMVIQICF